VTVETRLATPDDIDGLVRAHQLAFPGFFLTLLGPAFLARLYHGFATETDVATLLVVADGREVAGFLAGSGAPQEFFRRMRRKHGLYMAFAAVPSLFRHPLRVAERILSAARYGGDQPPDLPGFSLLSSLGVRGDQAGRGIGEALVRRFCEQAAACGARGVYLLTDADGNERALGFYHKCGFRQHSVRIRGDGRRLAVITRSFIDE
jgi:ribosomal protein S18 acetylase RimI-like enzyme